MEQATHDIAFHLSDCFIYYFRISWRCWVFYYQTTIVPGETFYHWVSQTSSSTFYNLTWLFPSYEDLYPFFYLHDLHNLILIWWYYHHVVYGLCSSHSTLLSPHHRACEHSACYVVLVTSSILFWMLFAPSLSLVPHSYIVEYNDVSKMTILTRNDQKVTCFDTGDFAQK